MFLLILQAITASVIAAPLPPERAGFLATPTAAARALSVERVADLPATPVTFTFQCLVFANGAISDCIEAAEGGTRDPKVFAARAATLRHAVAANPLLRAARARTDFYRLRATMEYSPRAMRTRVRETRSVIIPITVSAADRPISARGIVDKSEIQVDPATPVNLAPFYPPVARRAGVGAAVTATCRVLADRSLWCRDAAIDSPVEGRGAAIDDAFRRATIGALATMRVLATLKSGGHSIGREARMRVGWYLPE